MIDQPLPFTGDTARSCPFCGTEEPNEFLLDTNHGPSSRRAGSEQECVAQWIVGAHIRYYTMRLAKGDADPDPVCPCHRRYNADCCRKRLAQAQNRHALLTIAEQPTQTRDPEAVAT